MRAVNKRCGAPRKQNKTISTEGFTLRLPWHNVEHPDNKVHEPWPF